MTGNHSNSDNPHHLAGTAHEEDLLSTALRYVLNEMAVEERAEFECRLLDRQDAREAVAEAVGLCQSAKYAIHAVMREAVPVAAQRSVDGAVPVQPASQTERVWRSPAACAAMVVAASIVVAIIATGIRDDNPFKADVRNATADVESAASQSQTNGQADRAKQLAVAWLRFLPSADDGNSNDPISDENAALGGDEDFIARIDSATAADDWVFQAVAAEPSSSNNANPREG